MALMEPSKLYIGSKQSAYRQRTKIEEEEEDDSFEHGGVIVRRYMIHLKYLPSAPLAAEG